MKRKTTTFFILTFTMLTTPGLSQSIPEDKVVASEEEVLYYTYKWDGERLPDGRPMVSDDLLERLEKLKIADIWQLLDELGYHNQFEEGWKMLHDDVPIVGRALTALYMPSRPDIEERLTREGLKAGHIGPMNSWPIDMLQKGDVYLADSFGKITDGILIGSNLGNTIFAKTGTGVVFNGSIRDIGELEEIEGFNAFVRGWHPSFPKEVMLMGINVPVRIGSVTVMPGDVVLAKRIGVLFIPAHLIEQVVITAEIIKLRDEFAQARLKAGVYTPGQIDTRWTQEIEMDFLNWLKDNRMDRLPVPIDEMQEFLQHRTW